MAEIESYFNGKMLDENQRAVVDVFAGKRNNIAIEVERPEGTTHVVMRQGKEQNAGTKHSVFRHFDTRSNFITCDDIAMIPEIIANGNREENGEKVSYSLIAENGTLLKVTTEIYAGREVFTNLLSNRKTSKTESRNNTQLSARATESEVLDANLGNNSEFSKSIDDNVMLREQLS